MKFKYVLFLVIFFANSPVFATDVVSGPFLFKLVGNWEVKREQTGEVRAIRSENKSSRAFLLSVYYPSNLSEGTNHIIFLENHLGGLSQKNAALTKATDFEEYTTLRGAPFKYIVYSYNHGEGFLIGSLLGSNAGNVLITYEGIGSQKELIGEFKNIIESMSYNGT